MDGKSVGSPSTSATHVARTDCPHLTDPERKALERLSTVILVIVTVDQKKRKEPVDAVRPTDNAVTCVYNGHAVLRTAATRYLVILKAKSMTKRADSLRVLVDFGELNNFVLQQCLPLLDFEEKHVPRSQLEVFVEEFLVLDLDDKFDMVLGISWLARHDPIID
ncbi:reverse transcriptase [Phytophthora megakarya]|uniref:Reverse transcriptase n=1 Tax=Phytophthora megakarya TaxID=4795 RepID=A0A225VHC5_9STRA|nr:reverse transcriptase [Phytophthora megakarya]